MKWLGALNTNARSTISDKFFVISLKVLLPFIKNEANDARWRPYQAPVTETNTAAATFVSRVISGLRRGV